MKTKAELIVEIAKLRERLEMAAIFEVAPGITVGLSQEDDLWRIRKEYGHYSFLFLNKDKVWEEQPHHEPLEAFALNTGYKTAEEALDAYENYTIDNPFYQVPIIYSNVQNILKNN